MLSSALSPAGTGDVVSAQCKAAAPDQHTENTGDDKSSADESDTSPQAQATKHAAVTRRCCWLCDDDANVGLWHCRSGVPAAWRQCPYSRGGACVGYRWHDTQSTATPGTVRWTSGTSRTGNVRLWLPYNVSRRPVVADNVAGVSVSAGARVL